jgi:hypothetical protein
MLCGLSAQDRENGDVGTVKPPSLTQQPSPVSVICKHSSYVHKRGVRIVEQQPD